jgi:hypothetical protein
MNDEVTILRKKKSNTGLMGSLIFLIVILCGATGYFFYQYRLLSKNPAAAVQASVQKETDKLVKEVGKLMILPKDETPTVATITDIDKLKDQQFFKDAKNDNKVLIYPNAKLAIIYDPKSNLIVNVGPINFSQQEATQTQQARIVLRNGTTVTGLTSKIETEIKKSFPNANVVLKDQDKKTDYEKTIVVSLIDTSKPAAEELAKKMNYQTANLPDGENKPENVDILIIIGKDKS